MDRFHRVPYSIGRLLIHCAWIGWALLMSTQSVAQFGGAGGNAGGGGNQFGGGGGGGGGNQFGGGGGNQVGGILIDAEGVLRSRETKPLSAKLRKQGRDAFVARHLSDELVSFSERRYVSLVRLEEECQRRLQSGEPLSEQVRYLAGLQRIDFLFVDLDGADLVLAGPAEGFIPDETGRMVGMTTGRPPLRLDDFLVALQAADSGVTSIGCSIDPEPQRLAKMQEFVKRNNSETSPAGAARRFHQMAEILGRQHISVFGVSADSHFAITLIEADFRMKRISLGAERSGVRGLKSHLSLLRPNGNSIQRWWFTPYYDGLFANEDGTTYQLTGQRVQLLAQEEISDAFGERSDAAVTRASAQDFAKMFTQRFPELADHSPLFAELQNLFDLAVITALFRQEALPERVGWERELFSQRLTDLVPSYAVPRHVPSMSTFRRARRGLILGLVGGVTITPRQVLQQIDANAEGAIRLDGQQRAAVEARPKDHLAWWWD